MFFTYETLIKSSGPLYVKIYFTDTETPYTLDELFHLWIGYYESQTEFVFIFHTKDLIQIPRIWYAFKMAMFLYSLKYRYPIKHYLQHSHILIQSAGLQRLLEWIFAIQLPVAPVSIYHADEYEESLEPSVVIYP